jgi:hypothetical protein
MTQLTAIHEAGHALQAWRHKIPIRSISLVPGDGYSGITRFDPSNLEEKDELTCVSVLLAGELAERRAWGRPERINWFQTDTTFDGDLDSARYFADRQPEPLDARQLAELKARSSLVTYWPAVQALADELERRKVLVPDRVDAIFGAAGVRKVGQIDPETHYVNVTGVGPVSLRAWSNALDANARDRPRAIRAIKGGKR